MKHLIFLAAVIMIGIATLAPPATSAHVQARAGSIDNNAPPLSVSGSGFEIHDFRTGATAFLNRDYTWTALPATMEGWQFTELSGGRAAQITVRAASGGFVYIAVDSTTPQLASGLPGWVLQPDLNLSLSDKKRTTYSIYRARCEANLSLTVPQVGWSGGIVLAPGLTAPTEAAVSRPPGVVIDYLPAASHVFVGSPSIAILPDGTYVASHDKFFGATDGDHTLVFQSHDRGLTWQPVADIARQYWSNLFVFRGALYLCGTSRGFGQAVIRRSLDDGRTWTTPADASTGILTAERGISTAPTPVVEYDGRLWRAFELNPMGVRGRHFAAFFLSAPVDSDLLRADSWTRSNLLPYNMSETGGNWLEGNAIAAPGGGIAGLYRISKDGLEKAALMTVSADGRTLSWDPQGDRIDFPGGGVKFTIRYDPVSRRYWSLVNKQRSPDALRNVLALTSSPDLRHWRVEATLLQHPDRTKHAFQYVDWVFDGDDIAAVSRTSWDGDTFHNANYLTFHRIKNFREPDRTIGP